MDIRGKNAQRQLPVIEATLQVTLCNEGYLVVVHKVVASPQGPLQAPAERYALATSGEVLDKVKGFVQGSAAQQSGLALPELQVPSNFDPRGGKA